METAISNLTGSIVHIRTSRLHDIFLKHTTGTCLEFIGIVRPFSDPALEVRITKVEGEFWEDGLAVHGTTTWNGKRYSVKIVFTFNPDRDPEKVAGTYEMEEGDERDYGKPD